MLFRLVKRVGWGVGGALVVLLMLTMATARPGDRTLWPAQLGASRVEMFVVNHGYHSGIVIPRAALARHANAGGLLPLGHVATRFAGYAWLEFGWGEEGFYTQVPDISSLTVGAALRALFRPGNRTVLHVVGIASDPHAAFTRLEIVPVALTEAGFDRLLDRLDAAFAREADSRLPHELGPGLYGPSLFFRANGAFHLFNVCNHWIADLLDAAGVPTAPVLATLPAGLLLDLRWRAGLTPVGPHAVPARRDPGPPIPTMSFGSTARGVLE